MLAAYSTHAQTNNSSGKETVPNSSTNTTDPVNKNTSAKQDNAGTSNNYSGSSSNTNTTTGSGNANTGNGSNYKYGDSTAAGKEYREPMVGGGGGGTAGMEPNTGKAPVKNKKKAAPKTDTGPSKSTSVKSNSPYNK